MADRDITAFAVLEIDSASQGNKELETVKSLSITETNTSKPVETMSRTRRPIGIQSGVPKFTWEIEDFIPKGIKPDCDWQVLMRTKEKFTLTYEEDVDGLRRQLTSCWVDEVNRSTTRAATRS
jgi:hypothetical protein